MINQSISLFSSILQVFHSLNVCIHFSFLSISQCYRYFIPFSTLKTIHKTREWIRFNHFLSIFSMLNSFYCRMKYDINYRCAKCIECSPLRRLRDFGGIRALITISDPRVMWSETRRIQDITINCHCIRLLRWISESIEYMKCLSVILNHHCISESPLLMSSEFNVISMKCLTRFQCVHWMCGSLQFTDHCWPTARLRSHVSRADPDHRRWSLGGRAPSAWPTSPKRSAKTKTWPSALSTWRRPSRTMARSCRAGLTTQFCPTRPSRTLGFSTCIVSRNLI